LANPLKQKLATQFLERLHGIDNFILIPVLLSFNGESIVRKEFVGPLHYTYTQNTIKSEGCNDTLKVDSNACAFVRPSQPYGVDETIMSANTRASDLSSDKNFSPFWISIKNGIRCDAGDDGVKQTIDFVVVVFESFYNSSSPITVFGGDRVFDSSLSPPIGDSHFVMSRECQIKNVLDLLWDVVNPSL